MFNGSRELVQLLRHYCLSFQMVCLSLSGEERLDRQPGEAQAPDISVHSTVDPHPASAQYQLFLIALLLLRLADGVNYLNGGKTVGSELRCQSRL